MINILVTGLKWLLGILAASVLALAIVMAIIGRENTWAVLFGAPPLERIDFAALEPRDKPNSFLLCPEGFCEKRAFDRESPRYEIPAAQLAPIVRRIVEATEGVRPDDRERPAILQPSESAGLAAEPAMQWDYIATTRHLKFPDLVTLRIIETGEGSSTLAIYGRAVYGRKDFGVNQNRIAAWIEAIEIAVANAD
ncbi:DUF1499 domain-containing protein [Denitrobaculum tricleocarpae]|uniref:DUF1499 domain-containing protein n=1 Tax=Denitrobaculum tricleocarpae TaxID=2591009 RepID=A0A545TQ58_9PROT|nr:DUF1499 domain-containing protein [Denitrobaculum tricleocarpae]TQV79261.1 DUF1499 domain-containing protein [Denitrobaculum tricleocarpae]